jgi:hypothetical protein
VAFPHESFPDGPYERTADKILDEAQESTWFRVQLTQGLLSLGQLAGGDFRDLPDEQALRVLRRVESTDFFGFIRRTTVLNLYDDEEVWETLGYEGPSFDKGGYVHRGFDDLDWLPEPRIDYLPGEVLEEIAPGAPVPTSWTITTQAVPGNQPGATSAQGREARK